MLQSARLAEPSEELRHHSRCDPLVDSAVVPLSMLSACLCCQPFNLPQGTFYLAPEFPEQAAKTAVGLYFWEGVKYIYPVSVLSANS